MQNKAPRRKKTVPTFPGMKYQWKRKTSTNTSEKEKFSETIIIPGKNGLLREKIVDVISSAKDVLCICSYIISDEKIENAIFDAIEKGVRVYILTAYEKEFLDKLPQDEREIKSLERHLRFIRKLHGRAIIRSSPDYHAKFVLSDPKNLENKSGFLLTCNLKTKPLFNSPEIGIKLTKKQVDYFFHKFIEGFWHESLAKTEIDMTVNTLPEIGFAPTSKMVPVKILDYPGITDIISTVDRTSDLNQHLLQMINSSKGELIAFAFSFDEDNQVITELYKSIHQGRKVTIFVFVNPARPKVSPTIIQLKDAGAEIIGIEYLHAKGLIADFKKKNGTQRLASIMTANFTTLGLDSGFEFAMKLDPQRTQVLEKILDYWKEKFCWTLELSESTS